MGWKNHTKEKKYKDIWLKTMEDIFKQPDMDCKNLRSCDSMDDAARKAAESLNCGRDVYLFCDSQRLCSIAAGKIREHEMHVSFHIGSLLNSM